MKGRDALLVVTVVLVFSLIVVGAYVTTAGFGGECGINTPEDWPLCNGQLLPPPTLGAVVEYSHRILASLSSLFLLLSAVVFWRAKEAPRRAKRLLFLALFTIILEVGVGGALVNTSLSAEVATLHQALALLVFGLTVSALAVDRST